MGLPQWMSRHRVPVVAAFAVLVVASVALVVWASPSPGGPDAAWQASPSTADPSVTLAQSAPAEPSTVATSAAPQNPGQSTGGGQSPVQPGGSGTKPRVTDFSYTVNGLIVTVTFTVQAPPDRGPFTCNIRRAVPGEEDFACDAGPVSRTWDDDYCCGGEIYIIVTDKHGVRSDQYNDVIEFERPERPIPTIASYWHDSGTVHVQFLLGSVPGDDIRCNITISRVGPSSQGYDSGGYQPCVGSTEVSFPGDPGGYAVTIQVLSDAWSGPGYPHSYNLIVT